MNGGRSILVFIDRVSFFSWLGCVCLRLAESMERNLMFAEPELSWV
jgi:hypothetical protein